MSGMLKGSQPPIVISQSTVKEVPFRTATRNPTVSQGGLQFAFKEL